VAGTAPGHGADCWGGFGGGRARASRCANARRISCQPFGLPHPPSRRRLAREPHGEAEVLLKLTEYRKAEPGPLEEIIFYTHPSTRTRIYDAMRWREQMQPAGETTARPAPK
jgi:hypothetical protein